MYSHHVHVLTIMTSRTVPLRHGSTRCFGLVGELIGGGDWGKEPRSSGPASLPTSTSYDLHASPATGWHPHSSSATHTTHAVGIPIPMYLRRLFSLQRPCLLSHRGQIILQYRNSPDPATKQSPATCLFGRPTRDLIPLVPGKYHPHPTWQSGPRALDGAHETAFPALSWRPGAPTKPDREFSQQMGPHRLRCRS